MTPPPAEMFWAPKGSWADRFGFGALAQSQRRPGIVVESWDVHGALGVRDVVPNPKDKSPLHRSGAQPAVPVWCFRGDPGIKNGPRASYGG